MGKAESAIGGSVSYFALAARFFAPVSIVAAIGTDFQRERCADFYRARDRYARGDAARRADLSLARALS